MKRSQMNDAVRKAIQILQNNHMCLPLFAQWKAEEWRANLPALKNLRDIMLGWDVTDFGSGDFLHTGSVLFTVRNGKKGSPEVGTPYAEKIIFQLHETEQEIPYHYHAEKTEDIINRAGGILMLQLYNSTPDDDLDKQSEIHVRMDGIDTTMEAGSIVQVEAGGSITLHPRLFHRFWAKKGAGDLVVGEISSINDDLTDNLFLGGVPRFAAIEEDEEIVYPLSNEYETLVEQK